MSELINDFQISFQHIKSLSPKINKGIQIYFLISGELKIETSSRFYHLDENDLLVINHNHFYKAQGDEHNKVMILSIPAKFMEHHYPDYSNLRFDCFSREIDLGRYEMIRGIRKLLANIMISYYRQDECFKIEMQSYVSQLLLILIRGFKGEGSLEQKIDTDDRRLMEIIDYLERNYDQMITLEDVASKHFLSPSYLSRYFKKKMGVGFSRYLMNLRLRHCMKDLLYTNQSISQIAMNNGFPNAKSFSAFFKEIYEMTPHEYRKNHVIEMEDSVENLSTEDSVSLVQSTEIIAKLSDVILDDQKTYSHTETKYEKLPISISQGERQTLQYPHHLLIVGEIFELLKEDVRSQILDVKKNLHLKYIGVRQPISNTAIPPEVETDEEIPTTSPYFNIDSALAFMKRHNLSLFIRAEYIEIARNEDKYFPKLIQFVKHCLQIYGESFVNEWRVMFYEPYYTAVDRKELQRVYVKFHKILKSLAPSMQVGVYAVFLLGRKNK